MSTHNVVGHVCPLTGRVAVLAKDVMNDTDANLWFYSETAATAGLDPWRLIDYIDPAVNGVTADAWLDSGACVHLANIEEQVVYKQLPR